MRIVLIENKPLAEMMRLRCENIEVYDGSLSQTTTDVALDLKARYADSVTIYIINVNVKIGISDRLYSENNGIQLLKHLRLNHIDSHVILYSWLSKDMLMSDMSNAIIFSKGVSFYRLPGFFDVVKDINYEVLTQNVADRTELLRFFKVDYSSDNRHFDANLFGIWKMVKTYEAYESLSGKCELRKMENELFPQVMGYMNSYHGKVCQYIFGNADDVTMEINPSQYEKISEKIGDIREADPFIVYVDDMAYKGWAKLLSYVIYGKSDTKRLRSVNFDKRKATPEEIAQQVVRSGVRNANLLLLDLRLKDERGYVSPSNLSGFEVLRILEKQGLLNCPVMIFTASNKIWTLKEAFQGNVMSLYVKEGLEHSDANLSVKNFMDLIEQIHFLASYSWIFQIISQLRKLSECIQYEKNKFWWESLQASYTYYNSQTEENEIYVRKMTERKRICDILDAVVETLQNDIRNACFFKNHMRMYDIVRSMLVSLSNVLDEIHKSEGEKPDPFALSRRILVHLNLSADDIRKYTALRNRFIYRYNLSNIQSKTKAYVNDIIQYLISIPSKSDFQCFSEENVTPVCDRVEKLHNHETITVELASVGLNGNCLGVENHGYYYNFVVREDDKSKSYMSVPSKNLWENVGIGDLIQIKNVEENDTFAGKMKLVRVF